MARAGAGRRGPVRRGVHGHLKSVLATPCGAQVSEITEGVVARGWLQASAHAVARDGGRRASSWWDLRVAAHAAACSQRISGGVRAPSAGGGHALRGGRTPLLIAAPAAAVRDNLETLQDGFTLHAATRAGAMDPHGRETLLASAARSTPPGSGMDPGRGGTHPSVRTRSCTARTRRETRGNPGRPSSPASSPSRRASLRSAHAPGSRRCT